MTISKKQKSYVIILVMLLILAITIFTSYKLIYEKRINSKTTETINEEISNLLSMPFKEIKDSYKNNIYYEKYISIMNDYKNNNYTEEKPLIIVNPFLNVNGTLLVMFNSKSDTSKLVLKGKNENDLVFENAGNKDHIFAIYGLYEGENEIILNDKYHFKVENKKYTTKKSFSLNKNNYFLNFYNNKLTLYDFYGNIRWEYNEKIDNYELLDNNHLLITKDKKTYEIDFLGFIYKEYNYVKKNEKAYKLDNNILYYNNDEFLNFNNIINKDIEISSYYELEDGFIIYDKKSLSFLKIKNDKTIEYIIGNKKNWKNYNDLLLKENNKISYPKKIIDFKILDNKIYLVDDNYIKCYEIDTFKKIINMLFNKRVNIDIEKIDYINKDILNKNNIYVLNNKLKIDNNLKLVGKKEFVKINTYNYYDLEKIDFISDSESFNTLTKFGEYKSIIKSNQKDFNISLYHNTLKIDGVDNIILLSNKGFANIYNSNDIDISDLQNNKYFIFVSINGKIYNTLKFMILKGEN